MGQREATTSRPGAQGAFSGEILLRARGWGGRGRLMGRRASPTRLRSQVWEERQVTERMGQAAAGTGLARRQGPPVPTVWASAWMASVRLVPPASWYSARASTVATSARACGRRGRGLNGPPLPTSKQLHCAPHPGECYLGSVRHEVQVLLGALPLGIADVDVLRSVINALVIAAGRGAVSLGHMRPAPCPGPPRRPLLREPLSSSSEERKRARGFHIGDGMGTGRWERRDQIQGPSERTREKRQMRSGMQESSFPGSFKRKRRSPSAWAVDTQDG